MKRLPVFLAITLMSVPFASADFVIDEFSTAGTGTVVVTPNSSVRTAASSLNGNFGGGATVNIGGGSIDVTAINNQGVLAEYDLASPRNFFDISNIFRVVFDANATDPGTFNVSLQVFAAGTGTTTASKSFDSTGLTGLQELYFKRTDFTDPNLLKWVGSVNLNVENDGPGPTPVAFSLTQGLVAVPEPASLLLSLGGLVAVGGTCVARRKLRKKSESTEA